MNNDSLLLIIYDKYNEAIRIVIREIILNVVYLQLLEYLNCNKWIVLCNESIIVVFVLNLSKRYYWSCTIRFIRSDDFHIDFNLISIITI